MNSIFTFFGRNKLIIHYVISNKNQLMGKDVQYDHAAVQKFDIR